MKSALRKNAVVEIFKTKSRFLSIFCIVAIGVAFFAGVKNRYEAENKHETLMSGIK